MKMALLIVLMLFPALMHAQGQLPDTLYLHGDSFMKIRGSFNYVFRLDNTHADYRWRFLYDDDMKYARPDYDDSAWKYSPSVLPDPAPYVTAPGIGWFRLRIRPDSDLVHSPLVMNLSGVGAAEIYLDGKRIKSIGSFEKDNAHRYLNMSSEPVYFTFPDDSTHLLAIRYQNLDAGKYEEEWGFGLDIHEPESFFHNSNNGNVLMSVSLVGIGTLFFTLFVVHLLFFLFYRKETSNIYFALFNLSIALLLYTAYLAFVSPVPVLHDNMATYVIVVSSVGAFFSLSAFTSQLFSKKKTFLIIVSAISILVLVLSFIDIRRGTEFFGTGIVVLFVVSVLYTFINIIIAIYRKIPGARILGVGVMFCIIFLIVICICVVMDISINFNNLSVALLVLAIFSVPLSISAYLAWRFSFISKSLRLQLQNVEQLSVEKQSILENQNSFLEKKVAERTEEIKREKQKSDELLLNILPQEIAEELKSKGESKAHQYDDVSVLFTDFVNFTKISEQLGVQELLLELNINFTAFDRIMEKYGLEKIKTIGDAYLAVSGLPIADEHHSLHAVQAAIEILHFVEERKKQVPYGLDIRIGINSGSLIAGIVGVKKFAYDIWGDTVNIAARMEQNSMPGKVNISESTYQLVKGRFGCVYRGKVHVKGKGEMDMYFVENEI